MDESRARNWRSYVLSGVSQCAGRRLGLAHLGAHVQWRTDAAKRATESSLVVSGVRLFTA